MTHIYTLDDILTKLRKLREETGRGDVLIMADHNGIDGVALQEVEGVTIISVNAPNLHPIYYQK